MLKFKGTNQEFKTWLARLQVNYPSTLSLAYFTNRPEFDRPRSVRAYNGRGARR